MNLFLATYVVAFGLFFKSEIHFAVPLMMFWLLFFFLIHLRVAVASPNASPAVRSACKKVAFAVVVCLALMLLLAAMDSDKSMDRILGA